MDFWNMYVLWILEQWNKFASDNSLSCTLFLAVITYKHCLPSILQNTTAMLFPIL